MLHCSDSYTQDLPSSESRLRTGLSENLATFFLVGGPSSTPAPIVARRFYVDGLPAPATSQLSRRHGWGGQQTVPRASIWRCRSWILWVAKAGAAGVDLLDIVIDDERRCDVLRCKKRR